MNRSSAAHRSGHWGRSCGRSERQKMLRNDLRAASRAPSTDVGTIAVGSDEHRRIVLANSTKRAIGGAAIFGLCNERKRILHGREDGRMRFEPLSLEPPLGQVGMKLSLPSSRSLDGAEQFQRRSITGLQLIEPALGIVRSESDFDRSVLIRLDEIDEGIAHCDASAVSDRAATLAAIISSAVALASGRMKVQ